MPHTSESKKGLISATLIGFVAIILWGFSPLTALLLKSVPPLQLTASLFFIAFFATVIAFRNKRHEVIGSLKMPGILWVSSLCGIFGFNYLYIVALRNAPAVEVVLIVNLWPIVMMLMSIISERRQLEWQHVMGAVVGLSGVFLCVTEGKELALESEHLMGYMAAAACAIIWPIYSLINRRVASEHTSYSIPWLCLASALIATVLHLISEDAVMPSLQQWAYLVFAGVGATGLSFIFWDYGVKRGDIRLLSNLSYAEPLIGILVLIIFGFAVFTPIVGVSAVLITLGAAISSLTLRKTPSESKN